MQKQLILPAVSVYAYKNLTAFPRQVKTYHSDPSQFDAGRAHCSIAIEHLQLCINALHPEEAIINTHQYKLTFVEAVACLCSVFFSDLGWVSSGTALNLCCLHTSALGCS